MWGVGSPFDEERQQAGSVILEAQGLPLEVAAVGTLARTGGWPLESDVRGAKLFGEGLQIAGMRGPSDEARCVHGAEFRSEWIVDIGLRWIGSDDFEIAAIAEREKSVLRAVPGMDAAERSMDTGALGHEFNA